MLERMYMLHESEELNTFKQNIAVELDEHRTLDPFTLIAPRFSAAKFCTLKILLAFRHTGRRMQLEHERQAREELSEMEALAAELAASTQVDPDGGHMSVDELTDLVDFFDP